MEHSRVTYAKNNSNVRLNFILPHPAKSEYGIDKIRFRKLVCTTKKQRTKTKDKQQTPETPLNTSIYNFIENIFGS